MSGMFTTPRPVPDRKWPALAGAFVVLVALPIVLLVDAPLRGWALGAVLWLAGEALAFLLARLPLGADNLAASGMRAVGMTFRGIAVMVVLIAVVAFGDESVAVTAAVTYIAAYSLELALSLTAYFGGRRLA